MNIVGASVINVRALYHTLEMAAKMTSKRMAMNYCVYMGKWDIRIIVVEKGYR